jgi:hypothetical protein
MTYEQISRRAYEIWDREGRPEGRDLDHWIQAEAEAREETSNAAPGKIEAAPQNIVPLQTEPSATAATPRKSSRKTRETLRSSSAPVGREMAGARL